MDAHGDGEFSRSRLQRSALAPERFPDLKPVRYAPGTKIYLPGDPSDAVYLIRSGRVRVYFIDEEGEPQTVLELGPGELFGELVLDGNGTQEFIAEALTLVEVYVFDKWQLPRLIRHPSLAARVSELLGYRRELILFYKG